MVERPLPDGWLRYDAALAAVLAVVGAAMAWLTDTAGVGVFDQDVRLQMLGSALLAIPLVWRRRFPIAMALVQSALYIALPYVTGMDLYSSQVVLFLGFYSIGAWSARRGWALVSRIVISVAMAVWLVSSIFGGPMFGGEGPEAMTATQIMAIFAINGSINIAFFAGAWVFGNRAWQQALERRELEQAGQEIRGLQAEIVAHAVENERLRIARELHDVVAHHVTAMSVQAAAARRVLSSDPARAEASLKAVESSARSAVADLRTMVTTLRSADETESLPTLDDVAALVEEARGAGRSVTYERIGEIPELTPATELTLYRVAQEGLTNVHKHAGAAAHVALRLRGTRDGVELEVSDDGQGSTSALPGTGTGLTGMRERIAAVGGTLEAGPKPRGGFLVRAAIPVGAA